MNNTSGANNFDKDIEDVNKIPAVANILEVICSTTGMGYAVVARVTEDRWIACAVNDKINFGLGIGGELQVETTLCHKVNKFRETVAIDHADDDPVYFDHQTPKQYGLQSYISIPLILKNGDFFGTLCAIDPKPALVNNEKTINMFKLFAELIAFNLDAIRTLSETEEKLVEEQKTAEIREQFIAMLGHDLRNPVNAISISAQLLGRSKMDERTMKLVKIIQDSTIRTKGLIDNILDFASGRLGGGIKLNYESHNTLEETLTQVINELKVAHPDRLILTDFKLTKEIVGDLSELLSCFQIFLATQFPTEKRDRLLLSKLKLKQIVLNYLSLIKVTKYPVKQKDICLFHSLGERYTTGRKD